MTIPDLQLSRHLSTTTTTHREPVALLVVPHQITPLSSDHNFFPRQLNASSVIRFNKDGFFAPNVPRYPQGGLPSLEGRKLQLANDDLCLAGACRRRRWCCKGYRLLGADAVLGIPPMAYQVC